LRRLDRVTAMDADFEKKRENGFDGFLEKNPNIRGLKRGGESSKTPHAA